MRLSFVGDDWISVTPLISLKRVASADLKYSWLSLYRDKVRPVIREIPTSESWIANIVVRQIPNVLGGCVQRRISIRSPSSKRGRRTQPSTPKTELVRLFFNDLHEVIFKAL